MLRTKPAIVPTGVIKVIALENAGSDITPPVYTDFTAHR